MIVKSAQHDIELLEKGIESLLYHSFTTNNSLYLLGSGASARLSKMEYQVVQTIVTDYYAIGIFDIEEKANTSLAMNLLWRHMANHEDDFLRELTRKIPDNFIKARINEEYAQLSPHADNPEYQVFLLARKWSTIIDMNYEGFSAQYLSRYHHIINMHGIANQLLAKFTPKIREDIVLWGVDLSDHSNIKRYPGEKQTLETIKPFIPFLSNQIFPKLEWLVIIGYSFANTGDGLNDELLYELLNEYISHYKKIQIIIIDPKPEAIAMLFEKSMDRVKIIPAYWNALTRSIKINQFILQKNSFKKIIYDYYRCLEE
jgi:hypothetical protein